jgi:hypothetical protein
MIERVPLIRTSTLPTTIYSEKALKDSGEVAMAVHGFYVACVSGDLAVVQMMV